MEKRVAPIKYIDNHHTAGHEKDTEAVRQEHLNIGWGDIGYNSVIERNGVVGVGRSVEYSGSHDPGKAPNEVFTMNQIAYAISSIGNYQSPSPDVMSEVQFASLVQENWRVMQLYDIPLSRVRKHQDQYATDCPGNNFPWKRLLIELEKLTQGGKNVLKLAVLLCSKEDYWAGADVAVKNGGCAVFVRGIDGVIPNDAMSATQLIVVGGATTGHKNEVLLSGRTKYDTAQVVGRYLGW